MSLHHVDDWSVESFTCLQVLTAHWTLVTIQQSVQPQCQQLAAVMVASMDHSNVFTIGDAIMDSIYYVVPWTTQVCPKHHLDRFICFCRAHGREKQTEHAGLHRTVGYCWQCNSCTSLIDSLIVSLAVTSDDLRIDIEIDYCMKQPDSLLSTPQT